MNISIDGGILAGGLSTRMDGKDKGLQEYQGQAMAKWVYQALAPYVDKVYINCNRNHTQYQSISPHTCSDTISGFQGPLAGLVSLMATSSADYLLVSPCDTPLLSLAFGRKMRAVLQMKLRENPDQNILIASKDEDRAHPLHLCISRHFKSELESAIKQGEHRVMQWMHNHDATWIDFSEDQDIENQSNFVNFNTLDDLKLPPAGKIGHQC